MYYVLFVKFWTGSGTFSGGIGLRNGIKTTSNRVYFIKIKCSVHLVGFVGNKIHEIYATLKMKSNGPALKMKSNGPALKKNLSWLGINLLKPLKTCFLT